MRWRVVAILLTASIVALTELGRPSAVGDDRLPQAVPAAGMPRLMVQLGHSAAVSSVAYSPDGKLILTGSWDGTARLWSAASGDEIRRFEGHTSKVSAVAFSPDGKLILTGSWDDTARLWDAASGDEIRRFEGHTAEIYSVAFSPDGKQLLTGSSDRTARLWDTISGKEIRRYGGLDATILSVAFSPDGKQFLTGSEDRTARLWDAASGKEIHRYVGHAGSVTSVAFSPKGNRIVTGGGDNIARLWDAANGQEIGRFEGHTDGVTSVAISSGGDQVLTGSWDHTARLWDANTRKEIRRFEGHSREITSVAFSPNGKQALTGSGDDTARIWNAASGKELRRLAGRSDRIDAVAFSPNGKQVLTGGSDSFSDSQSVVRFWDMVGGNEIRRFKGHTGRITSVAFSPDGLQIVSGSDDRTARLWNAASGEEIYGFEGHTDRVTSVVFSPDGKRILTGSYDCTARLWDAASDKEIRSFVGHTQAILAVAFSRDGKQVLTGSLDGTARIWDAATGMEIRRFANRTDKITSVAFSPDGKQVLTGSMYNMARLWDAASGREIRRFDHRHTNGVRSVAFSPDGKQVLTGSSDATALLWDTASGKKIRSFDGHDAGIGSVAFSPDGKHILTGSADGTSRLWDTATGNNLCTLASFANGQWAVVDSAGRFDASDGGDVEGLHWVVGDEPIELVQLKERYYDPGLLAKKLGFNQEPLRNVAALNAPKLFPVVQLTPSTGKGRFAIRLSNQGGGIGRVVVKINGKELSSDARGSKPDPKAATLSIPLEVAGDPRLIPGKKNEIEVQAFNAEGYLRSRGLSITFDDPRETVVLEKPNVWALVVGISHYSGGKIDLQYAAKDADDFATGFQVAAARLFGTDKVHLTKLIAPLPDAPNQPDANHRPTRDNLLRALADLRDPKRVKPTDILLVYMAGHGVNRGGSDDGFCYLTSDAQNADLSDPEVRKQWSVSDQELTESIAKSPAQHQVMILDTCHSGKLVEDLSKPRDIPSSQERALERLKDRTGLHILAGCAADSASYEASRYGQGVLTYSLLLGMRGAALKEDQFVDVATLFNFAVDKVPSLAGDIGGIQRPVIASPKGSSFDIGQVTAEDKSRIPLQPVRPMVLRTSFQDEDALIDNLGLERELDELFRNVASRGRNGPLVFIDAREMPGAYRVGGRYHVDGKQVSVTVRLAPTKEKFSVDGEKDKVRELARKIYEEVQKRLPAPTSTP